MGKQWSEVLLEHPETFQDTTIVQLFHLAVTHNPEQMALVTDSCQLTYRELDRQSDSIARALQSSGARAGDIIAVKTGHNAEAVMAFLGIWKMGAAYLYLDGDCPDSRNDVCVKECKVRTVVDLEFVRKAVSEEPPEPTGEVSVATPDSLAVVVYTSGSTGKPKGVLLSHRNLASSVSNFGELGFKSEDRYCGFSKLMFVASVYDIAVTFSIGATFYLIPKAFRHDIGAIAAYYRENGITVTFLPPIMAMKYQKEDEDSPLRILLSGSEPVRGLSPRSYSIVNVYASSESCAVVCHHTIQDKRRWCPIGRPVASVKVYIVDEDGCPVPDGDTGELWLSGPQISQGYLNRPEETKAHFRKNPFCDEPPYDRIYLTGDLVSVGADGQMEYHGRKDNMVKVRGFRVELDGVGKWVEQYPGIKEACCVVFMDAGGTNLLFGYYLSDTEVDHEKLREFLGEHLPYYMIPTGLIRMEEFPRTLSGKVDRKGFSPPDCLNDYKQAAKRYR